MSGRRSKRKGAVGERELAAELKRVFGCGAHRGRQYHGGPDSPDVVVDIEGVSWECKRCERLHLWSAVEQAVTDAGLDAVGVVAHRANHKPWVLIVQLDDVPKFVHAVSKAMEELGE